MQVQRDYKDFRLAGLWSIPASIAFGLILINLQSNAYDVIFLMIIFQVLVGGVYSLIWLRCYRTASYKVPYFGVLYYISRTRGGLYIFCLIAFFISLFGLLFMIVSSNGLSQDLQGSGREIFRGLMAEATAFAFVVMYFFEILMLTFQARVSDNQGA